MNAAPAPPLRDILIRHAGHLREDPNVAAVGVILAMTPHDGAWFDALTIDYRCPAASREEALRLSRGLLRLAERIEAEAGRGSCSCRQRWTDDGVQVLLLWPVAS